MTAVPWHPGERPISSSRFVSQSHFPPAWLPKEPSPCSPCRKAVPSPPPTRMGFPNLQGSREHCCPGGGPADALLFVYGFAMGSKQKNKIHRKLQIALNPATRWSHMKRLQTNDLQFSYQEGFF